MSATPEKLVSISWQLRAQALSPLGVAARGHAARVLAQRILQRDDESVARLEGMSARAGADDWLLFRGASDDLPWADGAIYLGRDVDATALLLPTLWQPVQGAALLQRALRMRFEGNVPCALIPPCALFSGIQNVEKALPDSTSFQTSDSDTRVLAPTQTLVFSLSNARRLARAPLEAWLRAQGEEPPAATQEEAALVEQTPAEAHEKIVSSNDAEESSLEYQSHIGDLRLTRAAEENR